MKVSIVMASYQKGHILDRVLSSIYKQKPPFDFEVIVVDDGSSDNTKEVVQSYVECRYFYLDRPGYNNPSHARNVGYKSAKGEVVITQSAEIEHQSENTIQLLVDNLDGSNFTVGRVCNVTTEKRILHDYTGTESGGKLLFLGALLRKHLIAIGGDSELYDKPGSEDVWFLWCLTEGLGLKHLWIDEALGFHYDHPRPPSTNDQSMIQLSHKMLADAKTGIIQFRGSIKEEEFYPL